MTTKWYEYRTLTIQMGAQAYEEELNRLGAEGFKLVAVTDLWRNEYVMGKSNPIHDGSQLIFMKEIEVEYG